MKKTFLIIFATLLIALSTNAQEHFHFTAKAGIGTSHFWGKHASSNTNIAWKAGIGVEYQFSDQWSVRSGLDLVQKGGNDHIESIGEATIRGIYLELPVMPTFCVPLQKAIRGFIGVGPYLACGLSGKAKWTTITEDSHLSLHSEANTFGNMIDGNMGYRRFDAGLSINLGIEYHHFIIAVETQVGCMQVNKQLEQLIMLHANHSYRPKNINTCFTLAYRFR